MSNSKVSAQEPKGKFSPYQKVVVAILAFLQFSVILDFMVMSPLGVMIMPGLKINPHQFGLAVSAYAFSAGLSGLLAAGFADRFDRKKFLMFFYCGFLFGTLLCALSTSYSFLLFARMFTGFFGGVIGSVVLAIVTDLYSFELRGRVMGFIQTAFAASQILGLPIGLYFANKWDWHSPFFMIVAVGLLVGLIIIVQLKPVNAHLAKRPDRNAFHHLIITLSNREYIYAFMTTAFLSLGGYMLMPFGSAFSVHNLGVDQDRLPQLYLITGLCAIVTGPAVGRLSDKIGKFKTFAFGAAVTIVMVLIYTNMGQSPFWLVVTVNAVMFVGIFSRMIPSQALMSAIPTPENRGSFMSINSSLQQISGGIASVVAGLVVSEAADGRIEHFNILGYILVGTATISTIQMYGIAKRVAAKTNASVANSKAV
jgi:predicted MFS family arabinose efflux permease